MREGTTARSCSIDKFVEVMGWSGGGERNPVCTIILKNILYKHPAKYSQLTA